MSSSARARSRRNRSAVGVSVLLAVCGGVAMLPSAVLAQPLATTSAESSYLVTTGEKTPLRCGAGQTWYVVAELPAGTMLKLVGESDGFFEVEYPAGVPAVVKVADGTLKADRNIVVLTNRTPLWAFNALDPVMDNCYKRVFVDNPLEPGRELAYIGSFENRKGELAGYRVAAPSGARGFVLPTGVRPANAEELAAIKGAAPAPAPTPAPTDAAAAQATTPTGDAAVPTTTMEQKPEEGAQPAGAPAAAAAPKVPANPNDKLIDRLNELEPAYQRVMRSDMERGEFIDLMESYNAIAEQATIDSTGEKVRQYADAKIALLQIRADLQEARLALQEAQATSLEAQADLEKLARLAMEARGYAVVGRLLTSAIYDGSDLPRMFRVQSLERGTSRTVAYVIPDEGLALDSLTGKIVGVRGEATAEATPRVPVIRASAVDVLTLEPAQAASAPDSQ